MSFLCLFSLILSPFGIIYVPVYIVIKKKKIKYTFKKHKKMIFEYSDEHLIGYYKSLFSTIVTRYHMEFPLVYEEEIMDIVNKQMAIEESVLDMVDEEN